MIVYFSAGGHARKSSPETILGSRATIMLTFAGQSPKPDGRFKAIVKARKKHAHKSKS